MSSRILYLEYDVNDEGAFDNGELPMVNESQRLNMTRDVDPFKDVNIFEDDTGYIVWRQGTGKNVELLNILAHYTNRGHGTELLKKMVIALKENTPFETIYGFTRTDNQQAHSFYRSRGFKLSLVSGIYEEGSAMVFSQRYEKLKEFFGV